MELNSYNVIPIEKNLVNESGFVYIFVIENKIFKIGSSINSIYKFADFFL